MGYFEDTEGFFKGGVSKSSSLSRRPHTILPPTLVLDVGWRLEAKLGPEHSRYDCAILTPSPRGDDTLDVRGDGKIIA